jgi:hypothetical protein
MGLAVCETQATVLSIKVARANQCSNYALRGWRLNETRPWMLHVHDSNHILPATIGGCTYIARASALAGCHWRPVRRHAVRGRVLADIGPRRDLLVNRQGNEK